jgi:hypothetical protein
MLEGATRLLHTAAITMDLGRDSPAFGGSAHYHSRY